MAFTPPFESGYTNFDNIPNFAGMTVREAKRLPEISLVESATGRMPGCHQWEIVWRFVRENDPAPDALKAAFDEWNYRGYRPNNLGWLEWAVKGIPPRIKGNGRGSTDEYLAALAELAKGEN